MGLVENFIDFGLLVFQVTKKTGLDRADIDTGRQEPLSDPVITPGALVRCFCHRIDKADRIGTGLDTVGTGNASFLVNENKTVFGLVGSANRAYLDAGRFFAHVAELGHKEGVADRVLRYILPWYLIPVKPAVRGINIDVIINVDNISFDPGTIVAVRYLVFIFIGYAA